ncbi:MAG: Plug domain-containing protein, partial [Myxococcales bacterium]|nr:Plug domain-containing protein [Myxococcales bacterium]
MRSAIAARCSSLGGLTRSSDAAGGVTSTLTKPRSACFTSLLQKGSLTIAVQYSPSHVNAGSSRSLLRMAGASHSLSAPVMALSRQRLGDALWAVSCVVAALSAGVPLSARADDDDPYVEAPPPEPIEVEVREPPKAADATTFTRAEVRSIPGTFGDPFRVVESIPGVVPLVSGVPYYYVRGAPPGTVSYTLDGIRVPLLFHLGLGPSVVHPALIDSVEVVPGPTPETGRAL